jgi:hypothetical protein
VANPARENVYALPNITHDYIAAREDELREGKASLHQTCGSPANGCGRRTAGASKGSEA